MFFNKIFTLLKKGTMLKKRTQRRSMKHVYIRETDDIKIP